MSFRKISVGLNDAIAFLDGDITRATVLERGPDGEMHDVTEEWVKTRIPRRAGSAGTETELETSHPAASPRTAETR